VVLFTWVWSYVFYSRGARIITSRVSAFNDLRTPAARSK
jgi:hypothetical protein